MPTAQADVKSGPVRAIVAPPPKRAPTAPVVTTPMPMSPAGSANEPDIDITAIDWPGVWQVPLVACAVLWVAFAVLFHPPPDRGELRT